MEREPRKNLSGYAKRIGKSLTSDSEIFFAGEVARDIQVFGRQEIKPVEMFIAPIAPEFDLDLLNSFMLKVSGNTGLNIQRKFLQQGEHLIRLGLLTGSKKVGEKSEELSSRVISRLNPDVLRRWGFHANEYKTKSSILFKEEVSVFVYPDPELAAAYIEYEVKGIKKGKPRDYKMEAWKEAFTIKEYDLLKDVNENLNL